MGTQHPLTEEVTKCSYPTVDLEKKHWYIISYDQDGIRCSEAYKEDGEWLNRHCWSISFTKPGQYEKAGAILRRFPPDAIDCSHIGTKLINMACAYCGKEAKNHEK